MFKNLNNVSIGKKIWGLVSLLLLALAATIYLFMGGIQETRDLGLENNGKSMLAEKEEGIRNMTHSAAMFLGELLSGVDNIEEKKKIIQSYLGHVRYGEKSKDYPDGKEYLFSNIGTKVVYNPSTTLKPGDELKDKAPFVAVLLDKSREGGLSQNSRTSESFLV